MLTTKFVVLIVCVLIRVHKKKKKNIYFELLLSLETPLFLVFLHIEVYNQVESE